MICIAGARLGYESSRCGGTEFGKKAQEEDDLKRKVTMDPRLMEKLVNFSEDEDEDAKSGLSRQASRDSTIDAPNGQANNNNNEDTKSGQKKHRRRHSLTVCETPSNPNDELSLETDKEDELIEETLKQSIYNTKRSSVRRPVPKVIYTTQFSTSSTVTSTSDRSRSPSPSSESSSASSSRSSSSVRKTSGNSLKPNYVLNTSQMHANLHSEFIQSVST